MKKCDSCKLREYDKSEFCCIGNLNARECIGRLQGALELFTDDRRALPEELSSSAVVSYEVSGAGTIWLPKESSKGEMAVAILEDCDFYDLQIEYSDSGEASTNE